MSLPKITATVAILLLTFCSRAEEIKPLGSTPASAGQIVKYSAFDKAKILTRIPPGDVALVADQNAFEAKFGSEAAALSLDVFRTYSIANDLIRMNDPVRIVQQINEFGDLIKWEYLLNLIPSDSAIKTNRLQADFAARAANLSIPVTIEQQIQTTGTPVAASGGDFTSTLLSATANLLLERGQKELANAFFEEISKKLEQKDMQILIPNTAELFRSRDVYTVPSLGSTWKGAFELDLRQMPENAALFIKEKAIKDEDIGNLIVNLVKISDDLISGDHPMLTITRLNQNTLSSSRFKAYIQFIDEVSKSLKVRRQDAGGSSPWATAAEFSNLGPEGAVYYIGFLINELQKEGIIVDEIDFDKIEEWTTDIQVLIDRLQRIDQAIQTAKNRAEDKEEVKGAAFQSLMNSLTDIFEVAQSLGREFEKNNIKFKEIPSTLDRAIALISLVNETYVAIQRKDYGKVLTYMLKIIEQINTKTYGEIEHQLTAIMNEIEQEIKKIEPGKYADVIRQMKDRDYSFTGSVSMRTFTRDQLAFILNLISNKVLSGKDELVREKINEAFDQLKVEYPEDFFRLVSFITEVSMAETEEEVKNVLDSFILPVGSFRLKRMAKSQNLMLQGYAGGIAGTEWTDKEDLGAFGGLYLPIGFSYSWAGRGRSSQKANYFGIFVSVLDLGAVGSFNLSGDGEAATTEVKNENFTIDNVFSPGLFAEVGWKNLPLTTGAGYRFAPNLRKVGTVTEGVGQLAVYLAVDIPLLKVYRKNGP